MFPTATVKGTGAQLHVVHGDDSGLFVRFYFNKVHEQNFVKINIPGDAKTEWDRPVNEQDKMRFRQQWELFQNQQNQFGTQTLLKDWDAINEGQLNHLVAHNVQTVEHLASMSDSMAQACGMGTRELVRKAQGAMAEIASKRQVELANQELAKRDAQIQTQAFELKKLQEQMAELMASNEGAKTLHVPKKASG